YNPWPKKITAYHKDNWKETYLAQLPKELLNQIYNHLYFMHFDEPISLVLALKTHTYELQKTWDRSKSEYYLDTNLIGTTEQISKIIRDNYEAYNNNIETALDHNYLIPHIYRHFKVVAPHITRIRIACTLWTDFQWNDIPITSLQKWFAQQKGKLSEKELDDGAFELKQAISP